MERAADFAALDELDPKLWVALACPVKGLELDEKTLALIDTDGDSRIRVPEVVAAAKWAVAALKSPELLLAPSDELPLSAINDSEPAGAALLAAARQILTNVATPKAETVRLEVFSDPKNLYSADRINGDGVIAPAIAGDDDTKALVEDIMKCSGSTKGRSGAVGVTPAQVETFFQDLAAFTDWANAGGTPETLPVGDKTDAAYAAIAAVRAKVDDYFTRCRLIAFDPRSAEALNRPVEDFLAITPKLLTASPTGDAAAFPIALADRGKPLPLVDGINPAWADAVAALRKDAVGPVYGSERASLTEAEWSALTAKFAAYEKWLGTKPAGKVAGLPLSRAREILAGKGKPGLTALLARDAELGPGFDAQTDLERLIRYRRDLSRLIHNFVNFADFYSHDRLAIFQTGFLYLDSRSCELCVKVEDVGAHAAIATMSKICIGYIDCRRPGGKTMKVAACFTQGDSDYLYVGRNGMFVDRHGDDWDATITKLIDNPISIRQAFFSPYKKFIRFVEEQLAKHASAADASTGTAVSGVATNKRFDVGTIAAMGVALGALSGAVSGFAMALFGLKVWMPLGLLGIVLAISAPSMLIAWLKLRMRTAGPLLEASGWAINGRIKINLPLGKALTDRAVIPPGSQRSLRDPYKDRAAFWRAFFFWLILAGIAAFFITAKFRHTWPFEPSQEKSAVAAPAPAKK